MAHDGVISISTVKASAFPSTCGGVLLPTTDEFALPVPSSIDSAGCSQYFYLLEALSNLLQGERVSVDQASQPKIKNIVENFMVSFLSNSKQEKMQYNDFSRFSDHLPIRLDR